ncbi:MAG: hypothetical protein ACSHWW_04880 [Nonlabens sp.]|uniref:hypothetical protein n=1 Tax=Nonlabens sp. TaxID=1888209 RepID=UPI003EF100CF
MNNFIHKTNQYLLERFPIIWNTKLLWMLAAAAALHILFFFYGFLSMANPVSLQEYNAEDVFFTKGGIFISIITSVLMIVYWLIMMFKNNAFKSFYPTRAWDLVKQFGAYLLIIFVSISFVFSFQTGLKTYINQTYDEARFEQDIETANRAALFFSHNIFEYNLNNKKYPLEFQELYCETAEFFIDENKPHVKSSFDNLYQYYSLKTITRDINSEYIDSIYDASVYNESAGKDLKRYYFKDEVVDVRGIIETAQPSYYHFSKVYYQRGASSYNSYNTYVEGYNDYGYGKDKPQISDLQARLVQENHDLLNRNDPQEIKALLTAFLKLTKEYKIKNNITVDEWFRAVYHPGNFQVKALINSRNTDLRYDRLYDENDELTPLQVYAEDINSDFFINTENLETSFGNIQDIKESEYLEVGIHVILWISFFIALLIFAFRLTSIKSVLFTIIAAGLLGIIIAVIAVFAYMSAGSYSNNEYFVMYLTLFIGTMILLGTILWMPQMSKLVSSIFLNLTMIGLLPYILLILGIITSHQQDACRIRYSDYMERKENCFILLDSLGAYWSLVFMVFAFFTIWWISKKALEWKSLPEG